MRVFICRLRDGSFLKVKAYTWNHFLQYVHHVLPKELFAKIETCNGKEFIPF